jgi:hypothetical protein
MRIRLVMFLALFVGLLPLAAAADHSCIDGKPYGEQVERKERLPREWLMINGKVVSDISLHAELRNRYKKAYRSNSDGTGGLVCLYTGRLYINVSKHDSGSWFEFSTRAPKCWKCTSVKLDLDQLAPGAGLRIGQTRAQVSAILGVSIPTDADIVTIRFREVEKGQRSRVHREDLRVQFQADKLISFDVSESWEEY